MSAASSLPVSALPVSPLPVSALPVSAASLSSLEPDFGMYAQRGDTAGFSAALAQFHATYTPLAGVQQHKQALLTAALLKAAFVAAANDHGPMLRALIEAGYRVHWARVTRTALDGYTCLFMAARSGSASAVQVLLDARASVNGLHLFSPLVGAVRCGHVNTTAMILNEWTCRGGFHGDTRFSLLLHVAAYLPGRTEVAALLLCAKAQVDYRASADEQLRPLRMYTVEEENPTPLHVAVEERNVAMVDLLLRAKADGGDATGSFATPLRIACRGDCAASAAIVTLLVSAKADVMPVRDNCFGFGESPLLRAVAAVFNNVAVVKAVLRAKACVNERARCLSRLGVFEVYEYTALHQAARKDNQRLLRVLLKAKADVHATTGTGETLLDLKSDVRQRGMLARAFAETPEAAFVHTPLMKAVLVGCGPRPVALLLAAKSDVHFEDPTGKSVLRAACEQVLNPRGTKHSYAGDVLELLVNAKANVGHGGPAWTALAAAVVFKQPTAARLLVQAEVDVALRVSSDWLVGHAAPPALPCPDENELHGQPHQHRSTYC
jgi:ankyrin repeat protein